MKKKNGPRAEGVKSVKTCRSEKTGPRHDLEGKKKRKRNIRLTGEGARRV